VKGFGGEMNSLWRMLGVSNQLLEPMRWLASIVLVLSCAIVIDAMRKWISILSTPGAGAAASVATETA
jgi:carbon starvation protein CstA